ncbi:MAG: sel1 repeat family protein [Asticcacaulis sp.]|uniref:tetratricopeptide repeat protein n=1 Tax=Asticcacaulis sp. TaxID=1872648 RepID=UPI0025C2BB03|nr:tetratricopeptide repeat protein [Asticcacaulis sp.]MCA1936376.1 sel1 repeat family protein [Asticcacaulis sp.]
MSNDHFPHRLPLLRFELDRQELALSTPYTTKEVLENEYKRKDPFATLILARCYDTGRYVIRDQKRAEHLYQQARQRLKAYAERQHAHATLYLAQMYHSGQGGAVDLLRANKLFKQAARLLYSQAESDDLHACRALCWIYHHGMLGQVDLSLATQYAARAARLGCRESCLYAAESLIQGRSRLHSPILGADLLEANAKSGDPACQYHLGQVYENGVGRTANYEKAYAWYLLASARGYTPAIQRRQSLEAQLSANQIGHIQREVAAWQPGQDIRLHPPPNGPPHSTSGVY